MLSVMVVAALSVHWPNVFAQSNGIEVPLLYGVTAAALALTGFGAYSLDAALGLSSLWTPATELGGARHRRRRRAGEPGPAAPGGTRAGACIVAAIGAQGSGKIIEMTTRIFRAP